MKLRWLASCLLALILLAGCAPDDDAGTVPASAPPASAAPADNPYDY